MLVKGLRIGAEIVDDNDWLTLLAEAQDGIGGGSAGLFRAVCHQAPLLALLQPYISAQPATHRASCISPHSAPLADTAQALAGRSFFGQPGKFFRPS